MKALSELSVHSLKYDSSSNPYVVPPSFKFSTEVDWPFLIMETDSDDIVTCAVHFNLIYLSIQKHGTKHS